MDFGLRNDTVVAKFSAYISFYSVWYFQGLATTVDVNRHFIWPIPDTWSLEEAATVPVVYTTAYYALVVRGNLRRGNKVLIHSGSGGVGQAAIAIALHEGCEVFTTVGSAEKRNYLKERFPQLTDKHFFNSRDTTFENGILKATHGRGKFIIRIIICKTTLLKMRLHD